MKKAFGTSKKSIDLGQSAMSPDHGSLTLSQTTNFGLFQTEKVCRRHS